MRKSSRIDLGWEELQTEHDVCVYCGAPAEVWDHVLPYSHKDHWFALRRVKIRACAECNSLLSNSVQPTLEKRVAEAKKRLRKKHRKLLRTAVWSPEELADLDDSLRNYIVAAILEKQRLERRLAFDYFTWASLNYPEELLP